MGCCQVKVTDNRFEVISVIFFLTHKNKNIDIGSI